MGGKNKAGARIRSICQMLETSLLNPTSFLDLSSSKCTRHLCVLHTYKQTPQRKNRKNVKYGYVSSGPFIPVAEKTLSLSDRNLLVILLSTPSVLRPRTAVPRALGEKKKRVRQIAQRHATCVRAVFVHRLRLDRCHAEPSCGASAVEASFPRASGSRLNPAIALDLQSDSGPTTLREEIPMRAIAHHRRTGGGGVAQWSASFVTCAAWFRRARSMRRFGFCVPKGVRGGRRLFLVWCRHVWYCAWLRFLTVDSGCDRGLVNFLPTIPRTVGVGLLLCLGFHLRCVDKCRLHLEAENGATVVFLNCSKICFVRVSLVFLMKGGTPPMVRCSRDTQTKCFCPVPV